MVFQKMVSPVFDCCILLCCTAASSSLPSLSPAQLAKLRHLTIVSLATKNKVIFIKVLVQIVSFRDNAHINLLLSMS